MLCWDLYNEPGNSDLGERSTPLVEAAFAWARMESPQQPLTTGVWRGNRESKFQDPMSQVIFTASDVISYHYYELQGLDAILAQCKSFGRPVICTEWLHRPFGQTVQAALPIFAREHIGWYQWGLVAGARRPTWTGAASATARRWVAGSMMCFIPTDGPTTRPRSR